MSHLYTRGKVYWLEFYEDRKQVHKSLKTQDKKTAKFLQNEIDNRLACGRSPLPDNHTPLREIFESYLNYCRNRVVPGSLANYKKCIGDFIEWTGVYKATDISERLFQDYLDHRLKTISKDTANHIIKYTRSFLRFAVQRNYLSANPLASIKLYDYQRKPPRFLSKEEIKRVLNAAAAEEIYPMVATAIYTGMRRGELRRFKYEDVDFTNNTVTVPESKSKQYRAIPLHPEIRKILISSKPANLKQGFNQANEQRIMKRIKRKAGLAEPKLGFHTLRHSFASHLIMNGVNIVTVGKYLGHADVATTQIYTHLLASHIKEEIKKLPF